MRKLINALLMAMLIIIARVGNCAEYVFVLDTSSSMNKSDELHMAPDSIIWMASSLSPLDELSIVYYKDVPIVMRQMSKLKDAPIYPFIMEYSGRSNLGGALSSAMEQFSDKMNVERNIIIISDGEIALNDEYATEASIEKLKLAMIQAEKRKVNVFVLYLQNDLENANYHTYVGYPRDVVVPKYGLMSAARLLVHNDLGQPHMEYQIKETTGTTKVEVPIEAPDKVKLLLIASNWGTAELKGAEEVNTLQGGYVKVLEAIKPGKTTLELELNYPEGTGLTLDVIPEVSGIMEADVSRSIFGGYNLDLTPVYSPDNPTRILSNRYFNGKKLRVQTAEGEIIAEVSGGDVSAKVHKTTLDVNNNKKIIVNAAKFEDLGVRYTSVEQVEFDLSDNNLVYYGMWGMSALVGIGAIGGLVYYMRRRKEEEIYEEYEETEDAETEETDDKQGK